MRRLKQVVCCLATILVAVLLLGVQNAKGAAIQWSVGDGGNGHCYEFVNAHLIWPDAKVAAESMTYLGVPGHLVTITSAEENNFVLDNILDPNVLTSVAFIGLTDDEAFGGYESFGQPNPSVDGWVWVTGEPVTFTDWNGGEPNNNGNEDYANTGSWGGTVGWNDQAAHYTVNYIVEFDTIPEPSTLILLSIGAISLLAYGRSRAVRDRIHLYKGV